MYCYGLENLEPCKKYITTDLSQDELLQELKDYHDNAANEKATSKKWYQRITAYLSKHKLAVGITSVIVIGGGVALVIRKKNRRVN